jgi:hypothetical protein
MMRNTHPPLASHDLFGGALRGTDHSGVSDNPFAINESQCIDVRRSFWIIHADRRYAGFAITPPIDTVNIENHTPHITLVFQHLRSRTPFDELISLESRHQGVGWIMIFIR